MAENCIWVYNDYCYTQQIQLPFGHSKNLALNKPLGMCLRSRTDESIMIIIADSGNKRIIEIAVETNGANEYTIQKYSTIIENLEHFPINVTCKNNQVYYTAVDTEEQFSSILSKLSERTIVSPSSEDNFPNMSPDSLASFLQSPITEFPLFTPPSNESNNQNPILRSFKKLFNIEEEIFYNFKQNFQAKQKALSTFLKAMYYYIINSNEKPLYYEEFLGVIVACDKNEFDCPIVIPKQSTKAGMIVSWVSHYNYAISTNFYTNYGRDTICYFYGKHHVLVDKVRKFRSEESLYVIAKPTVPCIGHVVYESEITSEIEHLVIGKVDVTNTRGFVRLPEDLPEDYQSTWELGDIYITVQLTPHVDAFALAMSKSFWSIIRGDYLHLLDKEIKNFINLPQEQISTNFLLDYIGTDTTVLYVYYFVVI